MSVLPKTRAGWVRLVVLPLQIFVAVDWITMEFYTSTAGRYRDYDFYNLMFGTHAFCFLALCAGALVQRKCGDRMGMYFSFVMALFALCQVPFLLAPLT